MDYKVFVTSVITVIKNSLIVKWVRIRVAALTVCSSASVHTKQQFRQSYEYDTYYKNWVILDRLQKKTHRNQRNKKKQNSLKSEIWKIRSQQLASQSVLTVSLEQISWDFPSGMKTGSYANVWFYLTDKRTGSTRTDRKWPCLRAARRVSVCECSSEWDRGQERGEDGFLELCVLMKTKVAVCEQG